MIALFSTMNIVLAIIGAVILLMIISCIKIVPQAYACVVERLGAYLTTWHTGIHFKLPFVDRVARRMSLKEQISDYEPQAVITKDNVRVGIDTVIYYQITDPKLFTYGIEDPKFAIKQLTATTLRNLIGELELDATLTSRDLINGKMRVILDEATDPWGIKVTRVEVKDILPPREIQDAMEKQMKAERERRESILRAEGEKQSSILVAEGKKQSMILEAEAAKQTSILNAEAEKEAQIRRAEGESEAILKVQKAQAEGIRMLNEAAPSEKVVVLKSYEALEKVADGKSTKIIIPSDIQGMAGLASSLAEIVKKD